MKKDNILKDEAGQSMAEYILLFGGIIIIAIAGLYIFQNYFTFREPVTAENDIQHIREGY